MPDLLHLLKQQDAGFVRIAAQLWNLDIRAHEFKHACEELADQILNPAHTVEFFASLSEEAILAVQVLVEAGGRMPWGEFTRRFGMLREMGPGQRDRAQPHFHPGSVTEALHYRAILGHAFFDTLQGPQEYAYIPEDLLEVMLNITDSHATKLSSHSPNSQASEVLGHPARPKELEKKWLADDRILDEATTRLSAIRTGIALPPDTKLIHLLQAAYLIKGNFLQTQNVKNFLEATRVEAHGMLVQAWLSSDTFNELRLVPSLSCEGEWENPSRATREFLLQSLSTLPDQKWWNLDSYITAIKERHPDFQRTAGDYDAWFIKRRTDGSYLRGFEHWNEVEGALIRFFITGILHWLGLAELAAPSEELEASAFRISSHPSEIVQTDKINRINESGNLKPDSRGKISVNRKVPRAIRYQLSRFCEWGEVKQDEYVYRISSDSLTRALGQGLRVAQLIALLSKYSQAGIPPSLDKALKRWEKYGTEARVETYLVLKVKRPEMITTLRKSKAARYLGDVLGPTAVVIPLGAQARVLAALTELGFLAQDATIINPIEN